MRRFAGVSRVFSTAVAGLLVAAQVPAQDEEGRIPGTDGIFEPVISINEVMVFTIDHNSHAIWDVAVDPPEADEDWHLLEHAAVTMATAGNMINIGGTGASDDYWSADSAWRAFAHEMSEAGLSSLEAVRARDIDALLEAGDMLVATCEGCHRAFKPELPAVTAQKHMHY